MITRVFQRGETIPIWAEVEDWLGVPFNPTPAGVKVTLKKPDGTPAKDYDDSDITNKTMSQTSVGKFVFYYSSHTDDPIVDAAGKPCYWWRYSCKAVDGTGDEAKTTITESGFELR